MATQRLIFFIDPKTAARVAVERPENLSAAAATYADLFKVRDDEAGRFRIIDPEVGNVYIGDDASWRCLVGFRATVYRDIQEPQEASPDGPIDVCQRRALQKRQRASSDACIPSGRSSTVTSDLAVEATAPATVARCSYGPRLVQVDIPDPCTLFELDALQRAQHQRAGVCHVKWPEEEDIEFDIPEGFDTPRLKNLIQHIYYKRFHRSILSGAALYIDDDNILDNTFDLPKFLAENDGTIRLRVLNTLFRQCAGNAILDGILQVTLYNHQRTWIYGVTSDTTPRAVKQMLADITGIPVHRQVLSRSREAEPLQDDVSLKQCKMELHSIRLFLALN